MLFGSVTQTNLADAIWERLKVRVDRRKIDLAEPLKRIGRYQVPIELFPEVTVDTRVLVVPEGGELPPEEELQAIEEAEAAEAAAAEAAAEAEHAEAEALIEQELEPEPEEVQPESEAASPSEATDEARSSRPRPRRLPRQPARPLPPKSHKSKPDFPQALPRAVDKFTKKPLPARNSVRRFCSATWGRRPTGWGQSGERAFPNPASGRLFVPGTDRRTEVVQTLKLALPATTNADVAAVAQSTQTAPVPPQNLDAEESVLGAMMLSPGAIGAVSEVLDAGDFYRESHAKIYRASLSLYARGEPVDAITLVDELEERGDLEGAGGRERIHELAALVPGDRERGALREDRPRDGDPARAHPRRRGGRAARLGAAGRGAELVDQAEQIVFELSQSRVSSEFSHIEALLKESFERITQLYEAGEDLTGVPSGFREIDRLTGGFQPGNLIIVAARPSMGKSALGLGMAANLGVRAQIPGGAVHARDVEVRGHAAAHVQRGEGRVEPAAHRQARRRRLAAADRGLRQAGEGADLRRRHGLDHDDGDPRQGAAPEDAGADPRPDHRRLPAADDDAARRSRTASRRSRRSRAS